LLEWIQRSDVKFACELKGNLFQEGPISGQHK
jgi:hypothetical protein